MLMRTLLLSTLAAMPLAALAESNSPWLPIPGQVLLGVNHTEQSGTDAYIGSKQLPLSAITGGGASNYKRSTTAVRVDYGLSDAFSLDAAVTFGTVKVGAADKDSGRGDSVLGLRYRVLDEYEDPALPTLTLRAAAILKGSYEGARLAAIGKGSNGSEFSVVLGKQLNPIFSLWAEAGLQKRSDNVPTAQFYEVGARARFSPQWSASLGYISKKFDGNLDIGGPGFSPARFQQVQEERGVVKLGLGYAFASNQGVALNLAKTNSGRNTVKDDRAAGLSYTVAF